MVITNFIYLLEVGECSLNKHSLTFPSAYTPSKEYARETVPTILLRTVDQPVVPRQVAMQKATATFTWKLVIDSGSEMVAIKIVLLTVCQSISSLGQVRDIDITPVTTVDSSGSICGCFGDGGRLRDSVERSRSESEPGRRDDVGAEVADVSISEVESD